MAPPLHQQSSTRGLTSSLSSASRGRRRRRLGFGAPARGPQSGWVSRRRAANFRTQALVSSAGASGARRATSHSGMPPRSPAASLLALRRRALCLRRTCAGRSSLPSSVRRPMLPPGSEHGSCSSGLRRWLWRWPSLVHRRMRPEVPLPRWSCWWALPVYAPRLGWPRGLVGISTSTPCAGRADRCRCCPGRGSPVCAAHAGLRENGVLCHHWGCRPRLPGTRVWQRRWGHLDCGHRPGAGNFSGGRFCRPWLLWWDAIQQVPIRFLGSAGCDCRRCGAPGRRNRPVARPKVWPIPTAAGCAGGYSLWTNSTRSLGTLVPLSGGLGKIPSCHGPRLKYGTPGRVESSYNPTMIRPTMILSFPAGPPREASLVR